MLSLAIASGTLAAIEPRDSHRLDVAVERIDDAIVVDGIALRIHTARGAGVAELARRMGARWRTEGGELQQLEHRGWHMLARWQDGRSELVQWRGTGVAAQLLHSWFDTTRPVAARGTPPFALPSSCEWGRMIEGAAAGRQHATLSALCRMEPRLLKALLARLLPAQGWTIRGQLPASLQVSGKGLEGELLLSAAGAGASSIVWVGTHQ